MFMSVQYSKYHDSIIKIISTKITSTIWNKQV